MLEKLYDTLSNYQLKHGNLFIEGINAYVFDNEGFYGPNWLRMGYLTLLDTEFYDAIKKILRKNRIDINNEHLFDDYFLKNLYSLFCDKSKFKIRDEDNFRNQLEMFLKDCIPGSVYFVVNEGEYIDLEEATIETTPYTEWNSLDDEEIKQWINDIEDACKLENITMLF